MRQLKRIPNRFNESRLASWHPRLFGLLFALVAHAAVANEPSPETMQAIVSGQSVYRYYCYQCHAYAGNARTLASTYLQPEPRDFTSNTARELSETSMQEAVRSGRPGTAMVSFSSVLTEAEIHNVVAYIREAFMAGKPPDERYHTTENGWKNHDRYSAAFPFVKGTVSISTSWEVLTDNQRTGKSLYMSACISCHDRPTKVDGEAVWELRAVSYPRRHYSHRSADLVSGASPYSLHETPALTADLSFDESAGMKLFQANCAFCHAPDGTARNWIGSFLQPSPRDFTAADFTLIGKPQQLREIIKQGITDTSMPAWKSVLSDTEIDQITAYMQIAFRPKRQDQQR